MSPNNKWKIPPKGIIHKAREKECRNAGKDLETGKTNQQRENKPAQSMKSWLIPLWRIKRGPQGPNGVSIRSGRIEETPTTMAPGMESPTAYAKQLDVNLWFRHFIFSLQYSSKTGFSRTSLKEKALPMKKK